MTENGYIKASDLVFKREYADATIPGVGKLRLQNLTALEYQSVLDIEMRVATEIDGESSSISGGDVMQMQMTRCCMSAVDGEGKRLWRTSNAVGESLSYPQIQALDERVIQHIGAHEDPEKN